MKEIYSAMEITEKADIITKKAHCRISRQCNLLLAFHNFKWGPRQKTNRDLISILLLSIFSFIFSFDELHLTIRI